MLSGECAVITTPVNCCAYKAVTYIAEIEAIKQKATALFILKCTTILLAQLGIMFYVQHRINFVCLD